MRVRRALPCEAIRMPEPDLSFTLARVLHFRHLAAADQIDSSDQRTKIEIVNTVDVVFFKDRGKIANGIGDASIPPSPRMNE
jgi:hypothetical protein